MITSKCPYCGKYGNKSRFMFGKEYSNERDVVCSKCGLKYKISVRLDISEHSYEEELKKVIPQEKINTIKKVIEKYFGYTGRGGYENSRDISLDKQLHERYDFSSNCYVISFYGRATYYQTESRGVTFYIFHDRVDCQVRSRYTWTQKYWFAGDTLEEQVDNYIQNALVKFKTI